MVKDLGIYETSEGKRYKVGIVEIDGKPYLYGDDMNSLHFSRHVTYGPYEGERIAKDYFQTKKTFLEKKDEYLSNH